MNECDLHQMFGCSTCTGVDAKERHPHEGTDHRPWSNEENRLARNLDLTTAEVAVQLGRTINQVSAHRSNVLKLTGWKGYVSKGHPRATPEYPYGRGNQGAGTGPDGERLI